MRIPLILTAALLGLSLEAHALQLIEVTDGETVTVKVSAKELTRIAMADGERIARIWGLEDRMQVEPDRDGGQAFLRPLSGLSSQAFSFFVRDEQGETFTLLAVPVDMPADTVLLRSKASKATARASAPETEIPYIYSIKALIRTLAQGGVPEGYQAAALARDIPLWKEAKVVEIARYTGDFTAEVYRLTNVSGKAMRLDEREFGALAADIQAVAIERQVLAPTESTRVYLVRKDR